MSTPNFAIKNASRYFVFGTPVYYTQEDIDECELDKALLGKYNEDGTVFSWETAIDNVAYDLNEKGWNNIKESDNNRNYPTSLFSEKTKVVTLRNVDLYITVKAGYTSGYYEAANFDWLASVELCGLIGGWNENFEYEADELEADDVIRDNWYGNIGLSKIHCAHIIKKISAIIGELKNEAEIAFSKYCDEEMYCAYRCYNGEAGYSTITKRLWQEVEDN